MRLNQKFRDRGALSFLILLASFAIGSDSVPRAESLPETLTRTRELIGFVKEQRAQQRAEAQQRRPLLKNIIESEAVAYLQNNPQALQRATDELYQEIQAQQGNPDPTKHVRLVPPQGKPGYQDLRFYSSHAFKVRRRQIKASNLVQVWKDFLAQAKKEITLNVYEFDLDEVAQTLIEAAQRGVSVQVGIDAKVVHEKPKIKAIFDRLIAGGVKAVAVNAVKINHQKMAAVDWSDLEDAKVLFSSGNLTQSCLGPEGDLKDVTPRPARSIPNANHVITMKSWLAANLVHHELSKTFSEDLRLRGAQYPTSGSYQITGPNTDPQTLEAYPVGSFILSFTPGGSYRSVNRNLLASVIDRSEGPIRLVQFAYSSQGVSEALLRRAIRDYREKGRFDFLSVGDTPFAMQEWSQFLKMSGLKRIQETMTTTGSKNEVKEIRFSRFLEDDESPWKQSLGARDLRDLRRRVRVAPSVYGNSSVAVGGRRYDVSAKIHHKLMMAGDFAVIGTSFNFSEGAETNNEQVLVFRDPELAQVVKGITEELARTSVSSVFEEAQRRNRRFSPGQPIEDDSIGSEDVGELVP